MRPLELKASYRRKYNSFKNCIFNLIQNLIQNNHLTLKVFHRLHIKQVSEEPKTVPAPNVKCLIPNKRERSD